MASLFDALKTRTTSPVMGSSGGEDAFDLSGALARQAANPGGGLTGNTPFLSRRHLDTSDAGMDVRMRPQWMDDLGMQGNIMDNMGFLGYSPKAGMPGTPENWFWNMGAGAGHLDSATESGGNWIYDAPSSFARFGDGPLARAALQGQWSVLNGSPYDVIDPTTGKVTGQKTFEGLKDEDNMDMTMAMLVGGALGGFGMAASNAGIGASGLSSSGGAAVGYGSTALPASVTGASGAAGAAGAGAGVTGLGDAGTMYGGVDAASAGSLGGGASVNGGAALGSAGATGASSGLSQLFNVNNAKKLMSAYSLLNGGGGGSGGGSNLGSFIPGIVDAVQQGNASDKMLDWMKSQQAKIDGLYNPGTPEYNALWDQMSRKDAAAGRNSQYGPRSVDLAARIAEIKANNTARLTTGLAGNFSNAFNQNASRYSGLLGALGNNMGSGGGSLIDSIAGLFGNNGNASGMEWLNQNNLPADYWDDIGDWFV